MIKRTLQELCLNITDGKHGDCENEENSGYYFKVVKIYSMDKSIIKMLDRLQKRILRKRIKELC